MMKAYIREVLLQEKRNLQLRLHKNRDRIKDQQLVLKATTDDIEFHQKIVDGTELHIKQLEEALNAKE